MSDTKIILSKLKLFLEKENEITGEISDQDNQLFWNDKKFIFCDQVLETLESLGKIKNKRSEFSKGDFKLTIIKDDKEGNISQWKLEETKKITQNKIEILAEGYYEEKFIEEEKITLLLSLADGQEWSLKNRYLNELKNFEFALKEIYTLLFNANIYLDEGYKRFGEHKEFYKESLLQEGCRQLVSLLIAKVYDKSENAVSLLLLNKKLCQNYQSWKAENNIDSIYSVNQINDYCKDIDRKFLELQQTSKTLDLLRIVRDKSICHIDPEEMFKYHILNSTNNFSKRSHIERVDFEELIILGKQICKDYAKVIGSSLSKRFNNLELLYSNENKN